MHKKNRICVIGILIFLLAAVISVSGIAAASSGQKASDKGAEAMTLEGGTLGDVPFPHRLHQENVNECSSCHELFPQESGAIRAQQKVGELKKQKVMNDQCIKCHLARSSAGKSAGPTKCGKCHQR
ncbi:MAG: cytochrome c family protein [Desulfobacteraceae bacterium]|nr:cytochrome c family protein [Desulfobacteraceae bacterium]